MTQIFDSIDELAGAIAPGTRLLGLDIGTKTIGLAISDPSLTLSSPLRTLPRQKKLGATINMLRSEIENERVGGLVAGLPIAMDGTEGPKCQSVRDTVREIVRTLALPAAFWDERLSTVAVERILIDEADMSRQRRQEVVDKMAAGYILQGALDSLRK